MHNVHNLVLYQVNKTSSLHLKNYLKKEIRTMYITWYNTKLIQVALNLTITLYKERCNILRRLFKKYQVALNLTIKHTSWSIYQVK